MQSSAVEVLVADPSEHTRAWLASLVALDDGQIVRARCATPADLLRAVQAGGADVALVGLGSPGGWLEAIRAVSRHDRTLPIVVLGATGSNDEIRSAMLAGGHAFLTMPVSFDQLREAIRAVVARRPLAIVAPAMPAPESGRLVAVVSARGGSGRSTIALNLAVAASRAGIDTVLVDANAGFGDIATLAGLVGFEHTLLDAARAPAQVDEFLTRGPGGVGILPTPAGPLDAERISTAELRAVLERLRECHDLVIVDTPGAVDEAHLTIVELADVLVVTVVAEIAAITNTRAYLTLLEAAGLIRDHRIVLNREGEPGSLETRDVRHVVARIDHTVAFDISRATRAANRGIPVVVSDPESALARSLTELAAAITGSSEPLVPAVASQRTPRLAWRPNVGPVRLVGAHSAGAA